MSAGIAFLRSARDRTWTVALQLARRDRRPLLALVGMAAVVAGTWTFVEIADEVLEEETQAIDVRILRALRDPTDPDELRGPAWLDETARDLTALGSGPVVALVTAIAVGYLALRRRPMRAAFALFAVVGGVLLYSVLKEIFGRARPIEVPALAEEASRSFPSGHAAISAIVYLSLAAVLALREPTLALRGYVLAVGVTVATIVGVTRVALGVHYPSDVLAGWAVGLAWAAACWVAMIFMLRRRSDADARR